MGARAWVHPLATDRRGPRLLTLMLYDRIVHRVRDGQQRGLDEGKSTGLSQGFRVGYEVGFYAGCLEEWRREANQGRLHLSPRALHNMRLLGSLIDSFQSQSPNVRNK